MRNFLVQKGGKPAVVVLVGALLLCAPGCLIVGSRDTYTYDLPASSQSGDFCPDTYLWKNERRVTLPFFRIENERLPHDLRMLTFDQTFMRTDEGFREFIVDTMVLEFANGETVAVISSEMPLSDRTFAIPGPGRFCSEEATRVFKGVITQRASFILRISGKAIRDDGEVVPFQATEVYRYDGRRRTFHTIFDEWANC